MITESFVQAAKKRIQEVGRFQAEKQMKEREPYLYSAMCFISTQAIADAPEMIGNETQTAIHDALWRAVLVAIEAYRVAQYHLWADTCLRPQMQSLHPDIASRSNPCELPRGGELDAPE